MRYSRKGRVAQVIFFVIVVIVSIGGVIHNNAQGQENSIIIQKSVESDDIFSSQPTADGFLVIKKNTEVNRLKGEINKREESIENIEGDIEILNNDLNQIYRQKDTLQNELQSLSIINKKNESNIFLAEEKVQKGSIEIESLSGTITTSEENIKLLKQVLVDSYQENNEFELGSARAETFIANNFFDIAKRIEANYQYLSLLHRQLQILEDQIITLEKSQEDVIAEREEQRSNQRELTERRKIYQNSLNEKERLITLTENSEDNYQELLKEKRRQQIALLQDILEYESKIDFLLDPSSIPDKGAVVFRKPFLVNAPLTQTYGRTAFAIKNAKAYGGKAFHVGVDWGIPTGTRLIAAAEGKIVGIGNTDAVATCQSWGKWILVEHPFGLSTLYAHLSLNSVVLGQEVEAGELIGYSGNTGFSTGPHLHFGVYVSDGIKVVPYSNISSSARCRGVLIPVASEKARLNPLDYLP